MTHDPVYIVSGYPRSGTTMMMAALMAGGLPGEYSTTRNRMSASRADSDYTPNPDNELYELDDWQYRDFGFPLKYQGKLVKAVTMHARNLDVNPAGTKVVFMRRNPEEIRQSFMAFFADKRAPSREQIENEVAWSLWQMRDRKSFDVVEMWYRDVLSAPYPHMRTLVDLGWPIDAKAAAAAVDPSLLRYRVEHLEVGVL